MRAPTTAAAQADPSQTATDRSGVAMGVGAYVWWGLTTLYWPLTAPTGAGEVLAHRVVWSVVALAGILALRGRWGWLRPLMANRRQLAMVAAAALLVGVNWALFIWATQNGRVLDASLGYFINPLVSVLLGVAVLRERLDVIQRVAVGIAAVGVVWLSWYAGALPWIGLVLALTFGVYGLIKKTAGLGAVDGLAAESTILAPVAVAALIGMAWTGTLTFGTAGAANVALLIGAGPITIVPLLLFAGAARRIPLSLVGLLQYLAPSIMFVVGVFVGRESMTAGRLVGFALVWIALALFALGPRALRGRGARRVRPVAAPVGG